MSRAKKHQIDFVKKNFGAIWPVHLSAFSRLLRNLRTEFEGDLDLLLVLAVVAERTPRDLWVSEVAVSQAGLIDTEVDAEQAPINIASIAHYSGIPRETVRRKTMELERRGWLARGADGTFKVQPKAATDLERATEHSIAYLSAILDARDAVIRETGG